MVNRCLWMARYESEVAQEENTEPTSPQAQTAISIPASDIFSYDDYQFQPDKGKGKGKGKLKDSSAPLPPSTRWLSPPAVPSTIAAETFPSAMETGFNPTGSLPSMQPFGKPKPEKDEAELLSLRTMYKELKGKTNLPDDIQRMVQSTEATLHKEDAKTYKQLIDQLKTARRKLSELDQQWEQYRVQWASYMEKASQLWLTQVEDFEAGENRFTEKRKETLLHLQQTRQRLHDVHKRTMESGLDMGTADVEKAQEAMDDTMQIETQDDPSTDTNLTQLKDGLTGVVKQVKTTIEARLKKRERSVPRTPDDAVEVVEPADKRNRDSTEPHASKCPLRKPLWRHATRRGEP